MKDNFEVRALFQALYKAFYVSRTISEKLYVKYMKQSFESVGLNQFDKQWRVGNGHPSKRQVEPGEGISRTPYLGTLLSKKHGRDTITTKRLPSFES